MTTQTGSARGWQRLEGAAVFAVCIAVYAHLGHSWLLFAVLLLVPDLSMVGYLRDARAGAAVYNLGHSFVLPALLALLGLVGGVAGAIPIALIWSAHIGMDRAIGYGLKLSGGFRETHLGRIGRVRPEREPAVGTTPATPTSR